MCGIAGLLRFDEAPVTADGLQLMLDKIAHRGRDFNGIALPHPQLGLGHRRLSIIDLHETASQPMFYAEKQLCITYNGEIYNYCELKKFLEKKSYIFATESDTEVLLAAYHYWGKNCVHHLNGMYAFALWDNRNKILFCARDPLGIKPFYYQRSSSFFAFASESFALTHLNQQSINWNAVHAYLLSMYVPGEESIFAGIRKLNPGSFLEIKMNGTAHIEKFWSVKNFETTKKNKESMLQLECLLKQAVKRQLRSDVPVGGFLSGGVDSGLITALAAETATQYRTYSIGYEGMVDNELPYAKKIAERYSTFHTEVMITAEDALHYLNRSLMHMSEPIADSAILATYILTEMAAADGVKVLLNGTGGDEIFAGYNRYTGQLSFKRKFLHLLPRNVRNWIAYFSLNPKIKVRLKYPEMDMMLATGGSFSLAIDVNQKSKEFFDALFTLGEGLNSSNTSSIPLLYQQMLFDLHHYLPDELLFLLDQMTMAHTLEGRVPLLDIDVIQAAFQFPTEAHLLRGTKTILKEIAEPYLGSAHIQRKKQGFAGSPLWWVKKNYQIFIDNIVELKEIDYFKHLNMDRLSENRLNHQIANEIFILYCFSQWYQRIAK